MAQSGCQDLQPMAAILDSCLERERLLPRAACSAYLREGRQVAIAWLYEMMKGRRLSRDVFFHSAFLFDWLVGQKAVAHRKALLVAAAALLVSTKYLESRELVFPTAKDIADGLANKFDLRDLLLAEARVWNAVQGTQRNTTACTGCYHYFRWRFCSNTDAESC